VRERDARDIGREVSPLVAAHDAVTIDTSKMSVTSVFDFIIKQVIDKRLN
jgi:cytidylate kinase